MALRRLVLRGLLELDLGVHRLLLSCRGLAGRLRRLGWQNALIQYISAFLDRQLPLIFACAAEHHIVVPGVGPFLDRPFGAIVPEFHLFACHEVIGET